MHPSIEQPRNRLVQFGVWLTVVFAGLSTRQDVPWSVGPIRTYGGDVLWAAMVSLSIGFLAPRVSFVRAAVVALLIAFAVECSQAIDVEWLDTLRRHPLMALVLGRGFLWSDFACYTLGVVIGAILDAACWKLSVRSVSA